MLCARYSFRSIGKASALRFNFSSAAAAHATGLGHFVTSRLEDKPESPSGLASRTVPLLPSSSPFASAPLGGIPHRRRFGTASAALMSPEVIATAVDAAFTPHQAALGGLLLAIATTGKLLLNGRVLGIAGSIKGLVQNDVTPWRIEFLSGLLLGSLLIPGLIGSAVAFDVMPETTTLTRMAISGFLVGYGASMANGCTSGHCISGNARLSIRSIVFTMCFMGAGAVSSAATGTMAALGVTPSSEVAILPFVPATAVEVQTVLGVAAIAISSLTLIGMLKPKLQGKESLLEGITEFLCGTIFSLGLGFCGMSHPTKLAGFLTPFNGGWDPSLIFVMGTAVLGSAIAHQSLLGRLPALPGDLMTKPVILPKYSLPNLTNAVVDPKLVIGGILFGLGVGGSGLCPGPDICNLVANYSPQVATHLAAMLAGLFLEGQVSKRLVAPPASAQQKA